MPPINNPSDANFQDTAVSAIIHNFVTKGVFQLVNEGVSMVFRARERRVSRHKKWPLDREPYYLETSSPGVFAAGDVRHRSVKRCASAVAEGAMAVTFVHR
jgi:thioredoxin reductase